MPRLVLAAALVAAGLAPRAAHAQRLSLAEAFRRADSAAYANRVAAGALAVAQGEAGAAYRGLLPGVRVEGGWMRTTDPLNAFGFLLRQRGVTPEAFAPERLNRPAAIGNVAVGTVLEVPLLNADAWLGRRAVSRAAAAADAQADWTRESTRLEVLRAWYGAVLAAEQARTLDSAVAAALAHVRQAESAVRNGVATRSDALLAEVKAGELEADLTAARASAALAVRRLALVLGAPGDTALRTPDSLPAAARLVGVLDGIAAAAAPSERADVRAARLGAEAAAADVARTWALQLPRVNAFGRVDWNDAGRPFGGDESWTVGVMVNWNPFSGGAELAERRRAVGRRLQAEAGAEALAARGALERAQAASDLEVARRRLEIAERGVAQAAEAHRIVGRKYAGGLATVAELLGAAAAETAVRLAHAAARYELIMAAASLRQAAGGDVSALAALDETGDDE